MPALRFTCRAAGRALGLQACGSAVVCHGTDRVGSLAVDHAGDLPHYVGFDAIPQTISTRLLLTIA